MFVIIVSKANKRNQMTNINELKSLLDGDIFVEKR